MSWIRLRAPEEKSEYYKNHFACVSWDNAFRADAASNRSGEGVNTTTVVKDAGEEKGDKGTDATATKDSQPSELCRSPRDQTMPPIRRSQTNPQPPLTQEAVNQLVREGIEVAIRAERERVRKEETRAGGPVALECTFTGFMKCGPTQFYGTEGAVGLCRWFERMESTFGISECAERRKVPFATATLHDRTLTWWNSQKIQAKNERIAESNKRRWENNNQGGNNNRNNNDNNNNNNNCNNRGNYRDNNHHNQLSHLIDIKPVRLNISYEVELADGKLVSTNSILRGCTLNLLNQLYKVDIIPIEVASIPDEGDMAFLRKKVKSGAAVGKRVFLKVLVQ
nr:putative zinc finger, CCHC-type, retrotransposon Gag domain protein [Tanacetum cinerariifolium]